MGGPHPRGDRKARIRLVASMSLPSLPIEIEGIKKILPHRHPFLFVDRITELGDDLVNLVHVLCNEREGGSCGGGMVSQDDGHRKCRNYRKARRADLKPIGI